MDCKRTTKSVLRRASLDHKTLREKIPWKNLRRRVVINRLTIAGLGAFLLVIAIIQTTAGVQLVLRCRYHLHYTPCYHSGDPCSSMATPAFFGCAIIFFIFCALLCASPRMLAILVIVVMLSECATGLYQRFSPFSTGGLFKAFIPPRVILKELCDEVTLHPDSMVTCWSDLESSFQGCTRMNDTLTLLCNLAKISAEKSHKIVESIIKSTMRLKSDFDSKTQRYHKFSNSSDTVKMQEKLELCFEEVSHHSQSHYIHYLNITVVIQFVCAFIHILCGISIIVLDQRRQLMRIEVAKRKDHEGTKCPDDKQKRKISREQQRISREIPSDGVDRIYAIQNEISPLNTKELFTPTVDDSDDRETRSNVMDPRSRSRNNSGNNTLDSSGRPNIRKSRSRSCELNSLTPSAVRKDSRNLNGTYNKVGNSKDVQRRKRISGENPCDSPRRKHTSNTSNVSITPKSSHPNTSVINTPDLNEIYATEGPKNLKKLYRISRDQSALTERPVRTSRDMGVQTAPDSFDNIDSKV